jgi:uncharacterized protein with HEPN domain
MLRDKQALIDIATAIQQTLQYAQGIDRKNLPQDDEKQAAILYRLIIIGEATKRLSNGLREQCPTIPWRQMAGLRDVVIHDYDELDFDILWNVVHINLPEILPEIQATLDRLIKAESLSLPLTVLSNLVLQEQGVTELDVGATPCGYLEERGQWKASLRD